jgi:hypothetical protein
MSGVVAEATLHVREGDEQDVRKHSHGSGIANAEIRCMTRASEESLIIVEHTEKPQRNE